MPFSLLTSYDHDLNGYQAPDVQRNYYAVTEDRLRRIAANDPVIGGLCVDSINEEWINADGGNMRRALSGSKYLRTLEIQGDEGTTQELKSFMTWVAENRSIEHLVLSDLNAVDDQNHNDDDELDIFQVLVPFFEHNINLRCIELICGYNHVTIPFLISALLKSNRLERIHLELFCIEDDESLACLLSALNGMSNLLDLCLSCDNIGRKSCKALGVLLSNSTLKIYKLGLWSKSIDDKSIQILARSLIKNKTIKVLHLHLTSLITSVGLSSLSSYLSDSNCSLEKIELLLEKITDRDTTALVNSLATDNASMRLDIRAHNANQSLGWLAISTGLKSPNSALVRLDVSQLNIDNEGSVFIAVALIGNTALKSLDMSYNRSITSAGWIRFFQLLLDSEFDSCLEELSLGSSNIDDGGAALLAKWLEAYTSLKTLDLFRSISVSASGWVKCIGTMAVSELVLEKLDLSKNNIDDDGGALLIDMLAKTSTVTSLNLDDTRISATGLPAFADVLRRPSSSSQLKELRINPLNDDIICNLATALANNNNLEKLLVFTIDITDRGWTAMENALCDISSIDTIYNSNHTLHTMFDWEYPPGCGTLGYLLEANYHKNKVEVARTKILQFYLSDLATVCPTFEGLAISVLPIAIEWIGRDRRGFSTLYHLLQGMPTAISA